MDPLLFFTEVRVFQAKIERHTSFVRLAIVVAYVKANVHHLLHYRSTKVHGICRIETHSIYVRNVQA